MSRAVDEYLDNGWAVVPVARGAKSPGVKEWPRRAAERTFKVRDFDGCNVGVVLGPVSKGLVDIDLDSPNAIELAEYFLPPTRTFGRKSKRASHWIYYAKGARSDALPFGPVPKKGSGEKRELVEIRAQNKGDDNCSHQSVFPGSVHESGEKVQWDNDDKIATVDAGELAWSVARLAVASALLPDWTEGGHRNAKSFGIAGGLLKLGWNVEEVRDCLAAVRECSGFDREEDAAAVERTIEAFEAGKEVTGFGKLVADGEIEEHVAKACQRHGRTPATRASEAALAKSRLGRHGLRAELVNEAREVDGMQTAAETIASLDPPKKKKKKAPKKARDEEGQLGALGIEIDLTVEPEPLDYLVKGLGLAPGKISAVGGYGGTGKGPLLTLTALCVASGKPLLGHEVKRGRVLYFDFETGRLARIRIARMARALDIDLEQLARECWLVFVDASGKRIEEEWLAECESLVEDAEPALVCIDSYTSAVPGDQNESTYSDMAFALGAISNTHDTTVLVAMHENKGSGGKRADDDLKMVSGTQTLGAALQAHWTLVRPDQNKPHTYELRCGRGPEGKFEPIAIEWKDVEQPETSKGARMRHGGDPNKWGLAVEIVERVAPGSTVDRTNLMTETKLRIAREVVKLLDRSDAGGRNIREIRDSVSGGNTEIKNVVAQLVADEVLEESGGLYVVLPPDDDNVNDRLKWGLEPPQRKPGKKRYQRA